MHIKNYNSDITDRKGPFVCKNYSEEYNKDRLQVYNYALGKLKLMLSPLKALISCQTYFHRKKLSKLLFLSGRIDRWQRGSK